MIFLPPGYGDSYHAVITIGSFLITITGANYPSQVLATVLSGTRSFDDLLTIGTHLSG